MSGIFKITFFVGFLLLFSACGYQPIAHKAQKAVGDKVYVEVKINARDPQNSVTLKDEISKAIFERLHANVSSKEDSSAIIEVQLQRVGFSSLAENRTGFSTFYRCEVTVEFKYTNTLTQATRQFSKKGYYNFSLNDTSVITDSIRLEAINQALLQAIDGFVSQVGIEVQ